MDYVAKSGAAALCLVVLALPCSAAVVRGTVRDAAGGALPGVTIEVTAADGQAVVQSTTDGGYRLEVGAGRVVLEYRLINFTPARRVVDVPKDGTVVDVTLPLSATASIVVTGRSTFRNLVELDEAPDLLGIADAASVGVITARQLRVRAEQRPGDVLETIPGVVISQHSGEGKANQYYLRGFNLDHGTDFATTVAGVPVNMPTHAHGQGYSDNNFLIPELISGVQYRKGPYYADVGDFSSAGTANVNYVNVLDKPILSVAGGRFGYRRLLAAASTPFANGVALGAFETSNNDGPWTRPDEFRKNNALLRYTNGSAATAWSVTAASYDARWNSTDQIPERAVESGALSRFGAIDTTDGGATQRHALSAEWQRSGSGTLTRANAFVMKYALDLFSNFTYFLEDPVNGDQFEQKDDRVVAGARTSQQWFGTLFGQRSENLVGFEFRHDDIGEVGLYKTRSRARLGTVRRDAVQQTSGGLFAQSSVHWSSMMRSTVGARIDRMLVDVDSNLEGNSGTRSTSLVSPKLSVIFGPWKRSELYLSAGSGFHSNDGRGATARVDPLSGEAVSRVDPLVRTRGAEVGLRTSFIPRLQSTLALWGLDIASELLFVGDAGVTEASRPSERRGVEWANYFAATPHLTLDADLSWSRARFSDGASDDRIPGALERVASAGLSLYDVAKFDGSLRVRYLGSRPLTEDDSQRSDSAGTMTAMLGYGLTPRYRVVLEGINLLNAKTSDIDYYYASRLPGEPLQGVDDRHSHPIEPRAIRLRIEATF